MTKETRKVKSVSFYSSVFVNKPKPVEIKNKIEIVFDKSQLLTKDLVDDYIQNSFQDHINLDEENVEYTYYEEVSLRLIDWIEKFKHEKVSGVQVFKLTNENLSVNHGYIRFNVYQADMEYCLNETNMCLIFFNAIEGNYYSYAEDNYKPSIDELFSTGWYIKND